MDPAFNLKIISLVSVDASLFWAETGGSALQHTKENNTTAHHAKENIILTPEEIPCRMSKLSYQKMKSRINYLA